MKMTITVGEKQIDLISSGATPILYRNEFNSDFFDDLVHFVKLAQRASEVEDKIETVALLMNTENANLIYNLAYIYAKNANPNIQSKIEWLTTFEDFPIFDVMENLLDLAMASLTTKKA